MVIIAAGGEQFFQYQREIIALFHYAKKLNEIKTKVYRRLGIGNT
jgi:hypothetical protein